MFKNPLPRMKREWDSMSEREKAMAVAFGVTISIINPLYPLIYGAKYTAFQAKYEAEDQAAEADKDQSSD